MKNPQLFALTVSAVLANINLPTNLSDGEGTHPVACLYTTAEGDIYGATNDGGNESLGTVFRIKP